MCRFSYSAAAVIALLFATTRVSAQGAPASWSVPPEWQSPPPPPAIPRLPWAWQSVGVSVGGAHYTESASLANFGGRIGPTRPFLTRGAWVGIEAEYLTGPAVALAARARFGWVRRGPPNAPDANLPADADLRRIDPQLGDSPFGGTMGFFFRFLPKRTALDVGLTTSFGPFRPRYQGHPIMECDTCMDGQATFSGEEFWPTARVSRTGPGFVFAAGTGESFVRTHEPGILELLLGYRWDDIEFWGGFGRGLAFRFDFRAWSNDWISVDLNVNPWNPELPRYPSPRAIVTVTLTRRWSSFAPL